MSSVAHVGAGPAVVDEEVGRRAGSREQRRAGQPRPAVVDEEVEGGIP
ncbi:MAG: hypothetical protein M9894_04560 [Planctomycetes bacterium]|nr:hypothetical protein [Planctomycetota bacterium]